MRKRHSLADMDYLHKLSEEERAYMKRFEDEYYKDIFDPVQKKRLHRTVTLKRKCHNNHFARRKDILNKSRRLFNK